MGKAKEGKLAVVFDANVIIASLIKDHGLNRYVVTLTPIFYPSYYPEILQLEVYEHIVVIAQKTEKPKNEISIALKNILEQLRKIELKEISSFIRESIKYVRDEEDSLYVATALYLKKNFKEVIIVTWNKRDFKFWQLIKQWIRVLTPHEFYTNYLRPVFSSYLAPLCLACTVDQLDKAIRAILLYLNESDYIIVKRLSDRDIELETYCHRVLISHKGKEYAICPQILDIKECKEAYEKPMNEERIGQTMKACRIYEPKEG